MEIVNEKEVVMEPTKKYLTKVKCPKCGAKVKHTPYCPMCGQRIKKRNYVNLEVEISNKLESSV